MPKDLQGKEMKGPPGLRGAKSAQAMRVKTIDEPELPDGYVPLKEVTLDLSENVNKRFTDEENYRAYKLFSIIDTNSGGCVTLRELKRCLMGDTFRTFSKKFDHPDTGIVFGLDEDDCVVVQAIEPGSPAALDPYMQTGLQLWEINGIKIPPHDSTSLKKTHEELISLFDDPVHFEFVEPVLIITKFSNWLDIEFRDGRIFEVELPVGAVNNLQILESKIKLAMRHNDPFLKTIHMSFDGKRRQAYFHSHHDEFRILFHSGPNRIASCKFALGFADEDTDFDYKHRGQPMIYDLELGVKYEEAEIVFTELFEKFDEDKSGEFEYEEFRDFYIRFLDTEESIQLLRDYAQYKFRDLEKEAYYYEQLDLARRKRERRAALKLREGNRRKEQTRTYKSKSDFDVYGVRRRVYGNVRIENLKMHRFHRKRGRVPMGKFNKKLEEHGQAQGDDVSSMGDSSVVLTKITPEMRVAKRSEMKQLRKEQDIKRRLILNNIYNSNEALRSKARKDAFRTTENKANVHMIEVILALKRAAATAVRMSDTGVAGITQLNVSMSHVVASPALIVTAGMFSGDVDISDIELKEMGSKELHPAVFRYFLIRLPKAVNAEFNSSQQHPAFFTSDYEREPSRHSSHGMTMCKRLEDLLAPGKEYREENGIEARFNHVPPWDTKQVPQRVKFVKPGPPLKSDRLVARCTINGVKALDIPAANRLIKNSLFVTVVCGNVDYEAEAREAAKRKFLSKKPAAPEFIQSTEVCAFCGPKAEWEDLDWVFRVRANDRLEVRVFNGSTRQSTLLGEMTLTAMQLIDTPRSKSGHCDLQLNITKDGKPAGHANIAMYLEVGSEFDWFRDAYQAEQTRLKKERRFRKFLATRSNAPKTLLPFPLRFTIDLIKVFDLIPVHLMTKNSPYVEIEYGDDHMLVTDIQSGAGSGCIWRDLRFKTRLSHERNNLIFRVLSDEVLIGRWAINGEELNDLPRSKTGYLEMQGTLILPPPAPADQTGRISIQLTFDMTNAILKGPKESRYLKDLEDQWGHGKDEAPDVSVVTYTSTYTPAPQRGILPARVRIKYIALSELMPMHGVAGTGERNSPRVICLCGRWSNTAPEQLRAGEAAEWSSLEDNEDEKGETEFTFPLTDRMNLLITVMSGNVLLGEFAMTARELAEYERNTSNVASIVEDLSDGMSINGRLKLVVYFDHEGDSSFVKAMIDEGLKAEIQQREEEQAKRGGGDGIITGYGNSVAIPPDIRPDGFHFTEVKPFAYDFLPHTNFASQPTEAPFRITINSVTVVDLRSAHTMKRNSPSLNAVCGQWGATAPPKKGAGKSATWVGLGWATFVYARNNLRIAVWSDGTLIGAAVITPQRLLASPLDRTGARDILSPLADEGSTSTAGQLRVNYRLESIFDEPEHDANRYNPLPINLNPPILVTLYTIAVMNLRNVHLFGKNHPFVKAACGSYFSLTDPVKDGGKEAKWENVMWTIYMGENHTLKLSVHSDTVVIGYILIRPRELCALPIDTYGLTALEKDLHAGEKKAGEVVGKIRIVCRLEAHFEEEEVSDPEEEPEEKETRQNEVVRKYADGEEVVRVPKISFTQILGIVVKDLRSMHTFSRNSPQVILQSGNYVESTSVQNLKGKNASWLDLHWNLWLTPSSSLRFTINTGTAEIGIIELTIQECYEAPPDDLGRVLITRDILFEGEKRGTFKVQLTLADSSLPQLMPVPGLGDGPAERLLFQKGLTPQQKAQKVDGTKKEKNEDVDFQRFDHLADAGDTEATKELLCPVLVNVKKISVIDLAPIHTASRLKNSPYVQMTCSGFTRETDARHRGGSDAVWEGDELDWKFVISDTDAILQTTVMSGWSRAGSLSVHVKDLLKMPRGRDGSVSLQGNMVRSYRKEAVFEEYTISKGKVLVSMTMVPYVTEEERQMMDQKVKDKIFEDAKIPRVLARMDVLQVAVADCVQVYGLFKNSPAVFFTMGKWTSTTGCAYDAGANALWKTDWRDVPIRDKADLVAEVMSSNELLGRMSMSVLDIIKEVPLHKASQQDGSVLMEIVSQITDGDYAKGKVGLVCRFSPENVVLVRELQQLLHNGHGPGSKEWRELPDQDAEETITTANSGTTPSGRLQYVPPPKHVPKAPTGQNKYAYDAPALLPGGSLETDDSTIASNEVGGSVVVDIDLLGEAGSIVSDLSGSHVNVGNAGSVMTLDLASYQTAAMSTNDFGVTPAKAREANEYSSVSKSERGTVETQSKDLVLRSAMKRVHDGTKLSQEVLDRGLDKDSLPGNVHDDDDDVDVFRVNGSVQSISDKGRVLSVSTPTPVATRVQIDSIECIDLKNAHTFRKNNPQVSLECGDFLSKTRKIVKGGQHCTFDKLGWVFVMRRMTFFRITVYSDSHIIGSVAISTRELLGIPKKGKDTIFRRNIEYESEITGKIRIICNVDGRYSVGKDVTVTQQAVQGRPKVDKRPQATLGELPMEAHKEAIRKKQLSAPELPMTVRVTRINVVDIVPLHAVAPNSPFVQISMGHFKKRTTKAFAAGSCADWTDLGWTFDIVDSRATITFSVVSGSKKAGSVVLTVKELLEIPRSRQGYTEVSGTVWTDNQLNAGQLAVSLLLTPFVTDEAKEKIKKKAERLVQAEGQTPRLMNEFKIDVVNIGEMTSMYKELHLHASCNKWKGRKVTESTKNRKGNMTWGDLQKHGWGTLSMYERSNLVLEVEGGNSVIGTAVIEPEMIMAQPVDDDGNVLVFCDLLDGDISVGKISMGGTISHKLASKHAKIRHSTTGLDEDSVTNSRRANGATRVSKNRDEGSTVGSDETFSQAQAFIGPIIKEPRWSEEVRVSMITVDECRSVHTIAKNSPSVRLTCGDWKAESRPMLVAGANATWRNLPWSTFRMKKKGVFSMMNIEVFSKAGEKAHEYVIGHAELPCELPLEASRDDQNRAIFSVDLNHKHKYAGKVIFQFDFIDNSVEMTEPSLNLGDVPLAKFDLNKAVAKYESTGSHLPAEDEDPDYSELMDATYMGDGKEEEELGKGTSGASESPARRVNANLKLMLPRSTEGSMGHVTALDEQRLSQQSVNGGFSIGTNETNNSAGALTIADAPSRPKTSRSISDSSNPNSQRSSRPPLSDRSWMTNNSPMSTDRSYESFTSSDSSYNPLESGQYTPSSGYWSSASSSRRSRDSNVIRPSDLVNEGPSAYSTDRSDYYGSSRSSYTDTGRSGYSSYTDGSSRHSSDYTYSDRSSTGRSFYDSSGRSDWTGSSYSNSSYWDSERSARTDPLTGGRTDREEGYSQLGTGRIEEELDEDDEIESNSSGGSGIKRDITEEERLEAHRVALNMRGDAASIAAKLTEAGIKGPYKVGKVVKSITFDIGTLLWHWPAPRSRLGDSGESESKIEVARRVTLSLARELVRGVMMKCVMGVTMEETNEFKPLMFKNPLACYDAMLIDITAPITIADVIADLAVVTVKQAVAKGGTLALNEFMGDGEAGCATSSDDTQGDDDEVDELPERKMGTEMGRRRGVVLTEGLGEDPTRNTVFDAEKEEEKEIDYNDRVFGKVRGLFTVPILRGRFELLDLMGFDVSFLDSRCVPTRPYMTACKPYGDWAAECGPLWIGNRGLEKKDMHMTYRDLSGQWGWPLVNLRLGQSIIFDFHDGGSGLIFCKLRVRYEQLEKCAVDENEIVTCYCEAEIANEYGGGITAGVLRAKVDLSVNHWERPLKPPEYWLKHTVHHWKTFPLTPVSQGKVKQLFRHVASEYDKQRIIHPAFYGFRIRWKGHDHDESKFMNPIFMGYSLAKKPPTKKMEMEARKLEAMRSSTNPFHYDVMAASLGKCPVCGDGVPGCPRCFMLPEDHDGRRFNPADFAFDPIKEQALKAAAEARQREKEMDKINRDKNRAKLVAVGAVVEDELVQEDSDDETDSKIRKYRDLDDLEANKRVELHTKLTTFEAIRLYRNVVQEHVTVFVKVLPGAYIRKVQVLADDIVWNFWNYFCSHSDLGMSDGKMMLLPTSQGFFEMCSDIQVPDEFTREDYRGREKLSRYGIKGRGSMICVLFMSKYMPQYVQKLLSAFFKRNSGYKMDNISNYTQVDDRLPTNVPLDPVQVQLVKICANLYNIQQLDYKQQYIELGEHFRVTNAAEITAKLKAAKAERERIAEEKARERRMESQLKGLEGEEREQKRRHLLELEKNRKGNASALAEEMKAEKEEMKRKLKAKREETLAKRAGEATEAELKAKLEEEEKKREAIEEKLRAFANKKDDTYSDEDEDEIGDEQRRLSRPVTSASSSFDEDSYAYDEYSDEEEWDSDEEDEYEDDSDETYDSNEEQEQEQEQVETWEKEELAEDEARKVEPEPEPGPLTEHRLEPEVTRVDNGADAQEEAKDEGNDGSEAGSRRSSRGSKRSRRSDGPGGSRPSSAVSSHTEYSATDTDYSVSTGTYTSRTGWSQADDWSPPPTWRSSDYGTSRASSREGGSAGGTGDDAEVRSGTEEENNGEGEMKAGSSVVDGEASIGGSQATKDSHGVGSSSKAGSSGGSLQAVDTEAGVGDADNDGNSERKFSETGSALASARSSAYSSTTLSTESSASSVALSSREIYDRVAWSRPSTGRSSSSSSAYSDGSYTSRSGTSSRFSFGTPRTSTEYEDDEEFEKQYRRRYSTDSGESDFTRTSGSYTAYSAGSSASGPRLFRIKRVGEDSDTSGSYTSRSGSTMTDFSDTSLASQTTSSAYDRSDNSSDSGALSSEHSSPRPSTGASYDYDGDSRSGYSTATRTFSGTGSSYSSAETTPRTPSLSQASADFTESMPSTARSGSDGSDAGALRSTEENIRMARIKASGGGYGKGSKRPDHRKILQGDKKRLRSGAVSGQSVSARMLSSYAAASEELIQQGYDKDRRAARNLPPLDQEHSMEFTRLAPTKEELELLPVGSSEVAVRVPVAKDRTRLDAVVDGVPDTYISTQESELTREMREKEEEMAKMLSLSNPNSRSGTRGRPRSQGKR